MYQWGNIKFESGNELKSPDPQYLSGNLESKRITQVACGQNHTLALTEGGKVYSWGCNRYGQLGTLAPDSVTDPVKVSVRKKIVSVACAARKSFALDSEGRVSCFVAKAKLFRTGNVNRRLLG